MDGYTTILIGKKTRARLGALKSYRRESYDGALGRFISNPAASAAANPKSIRRALALVARFCDGPKRSFEEVEAEMRQIEKEADEEVLNVP